MAALVVAETDLKTFPNGKLRMRDTALAVVLGYGHVDALRKLANRNADRLRDADGEYPVKVTVNSPTAGKPIIEQWYTEEQAYLLVAWSRTDQATAILQQMIAVFLAWKRGQLQPVQPAVPSFPAAESMPRIHRSLVNRYAYHLDLIHKSQLVLEKIKAIGGLP